MYTATYLYIERCTDSYMPIACDALVLVVTMLIAIVDNSIEIPRRLTSIVIAITVTAVFLKIFSMSYEYFSIISMCTSTYVTTAFSYHRTPSPASAEASTKLACASCLLRKFCTAAMPASRSLHQSPKP